MGQLGSRSLIALHVAIAWSHVKREGTKEGIPHQAAAWVERFEQVSDFSKNKMSPTFMDVLVAVSTGEFRSDREWIRTTAIGHIVGWRIEDPLIVKVPIDALAMAGGPTATRWVFDRFSKNYIHEWHNESVAWELSFALAPEETARRSGVEIQWLMERPPSLTLAANTLVRQHTLWSDEPDLILSGVSEGELIEDILHLVYAEEIRGAQELSTEACSRNPGSLALRRLRAFTLIPTDPGSARKLLSEDANTSEEWLRYANLVSCAILGHDDVSASTYLAEMSANDLTNQSAWLWAPESLRETQAEVQRYEASQWLDEASALLRIDAGRV